MKNATIFKKNISKLFREKKHESRENPKIKTQCYKSCVKHGSNLVMS